MKLFKSISLILLVAVIMMFTVSARADMMIKQATHTDSFKGMGGPEQPDLLPRLRRWNRNYHP